MKKISSAALSENKTAPRALVGRNIRALTPNEKNNPLIKKLLKRIQKPSTRDFDALAHMKILINKGKCHAFVKEANRVKLLHLFNLGTPQIPAFFYRKFIFVFDRGLDAFAAADINVIYFNEQYVFGSIADNLFFKFDIEGLAPMGHLRSVHVLDDAYVITTLNGKGKIAVYGLAAMAQKLFEVDDESYFEITQQGVNLKDETGCIEATYQPQNGTFVCF